MALGLQRPWQVLARLLLCLYIRRWTESGGPHGGQPLAYAGRPLKSSRPKATSSGCSSAGEYAHPGRALSHHENLCSSWHTGRIWFSHEGSCSSAFWKRMFASTVSGSYGVCNDCSFALCEVFWGIVVFQGPDQALECQSLWCSFKGPYVPRGRCLADPVHSNNCFAVSHLHTVCWTRGRQGVS